MPSNSDREAALRWAGDVNRLLPGEDPETGHPDDVEHWLRVYGELVRTKNNMVEDLFRHRAVVPSGGESEIDLDLELLTTQRRRLEARLEFWTRRGLRLTDSR